MRISTSALALSALLGTAACDSKPPGRDAAAGTAQRLSEVAVRIDAPGGGTASASVLAYRASVTGAGTEDVLSAVDPLVLAPPEAGAGCSVRDVAGAARLLGAQGGRIDLEALSTVSVDTGTARLQPSPRVFPDLASVVAGVVAEVGPVDLSVAPQRLDINEGGGAPMTIAVPALPRLFDEAGAPLGPSATLPGHGDLTLGISGPSSTFVELRPFGATWALACPLTGHDKVVVPAADIARLVDLKVPVSVEAVARDNQAMTLASGPMRLTLELRASSVIEFQP